MPLPGPGLRLSPAGRPPSSLLPAGPAVFIFTPRAVLSFSKANPTTAPLLPEALQRRPQSSGQFHLPGKGGLLAVSCPVPGGSPRPSLGPPALTLQSLGIPGALSCFSLGTAVPDPGLLIFFLPSLFLGCALLWGGSMRGPRLPGLPGHPIPIPSQHVAHPP